MENPATWTDIHWLINAEIRKHNAEMADKRIFCGASLETKIYHALLKAGHLKEQDAQVSETDKTKGL